MSDALRSIKLEGSRKGQSAAGAGASLAHLVIVRDVLPPIVAELEAKIASLEGKVNHILDEMRWHPNAISAGVAHPALQAASAARGGRKTRRRRRI